MKKCLWLLLVILISLVMVQLGSDALAPVRMEADPTLLDRAAQAWEVLMAIAVLVPVWLLALLGLARSFLGENWFPFAGMIPIRVTKIILIAASVLLVGVWAVENICLEYTRQPIWLQYRLEDRFGRWESLFLWILFYGILLYIEQWCLGRKDSRKRIRKKQRWAIFTMAMTFLTLVWFGAADLWYLPLGYVDSPNTLEDYYLWWFSAYMGVSFLPLWFFTVRGAVRVFRDNKKWLTLSDILPQKVTAVICLVSAVMMILRFREFRDYNSSYALLDVPEYGQAMAMGHLFRSLMWSVALFYGFCLLVKQLRAAYRTRHVRQDGELGMGSGE